MFEIEDMVWLKHHPDDCQSKDNESWLGPFLIVEKIKGFDHWYYILLWHDNKISPPVGEDYLIEFNLLER